MKQVKTLLSRLAVGVGIAPVAVPEPPTVLGAD